MYFIFHSENLIKSTYTIVTYSLKIVISITPRHLLPTVQFQPGSILRQQKEKQNK